LQEQDTQGPRDAGEAQSYADLTCDLEAGGEARTAALAAIRGCVAELAFHTVGCRTVQLALELAEDRAAAALAAELRGRAREAVRSPHANFVLQKIIVVLPTAHSAFIAEELRGDARETACHRYGCRVLCRLLEHGGATVGASAVALLDEALAAAPALCHHPYGHFVAQAALEHGLPEQRHRVAVALLGALLPSARHRCACYVLADALTFCSPADRQALVDGLLSSDPQELAMVAQDHYGSHVLRVLLGLQSDASQGVLARLRAVAGQFRATKHGRQLAAEFGMDS